MLSWKRVEQKQKKNRSQCRAVSEDTTAGFQAESVRNNQLLRFKKKGKLMAL